MSSVVAGPPAVSAAVERKRARRQAAQGFLSSISLKSQDAPSTLSVRSSASEPIMEAEATATADDPPLAPREVDVGSPVRKEDYVPMDASPPPTSTLTAPRPIQGAMPIPMRVGSFHDRDAGTTPVGSFFGSGSLSDRADSASIVGRPQPSTGRSPYVHLKNAGSLGGTSNPRILLSTTRSADRAGTPFALVSFIGFNFQMPFGHHQPAAPSSRVAAQTALENTTADVTKHGVSHEATFKSRTAASAASYDPAAIDDPALRIGKHHQVIALPSVLGSIIRYSRASELKKALNEKFRQAHPHLDPSITLSKIQKIKEKLTEAGEQVDLEAYTIACAFVFFERLVLQNAVNKHNRRAKAGACLLIATKMDDLRETSSVAIPKVVEALESALDVTSKDVMEVEFAVMEELEFDFNVPAEAAMPHFTRILATLDYSGIAAYLGPGAYGLYQHSSS